MNEMPRMVAVYWEDTGHEDDRVSDDHPSCTVPQCSVGFEVWRRAGSIALTHSRLLDNDEVPNDGLLTIPLRCVDKIEYLSVEVSEEFKVTVRRRKKS